MTIIKKINSPAVRTILTLILLLAFISTSSFGLNPSFSDVKSNDWFHGDVSLLSGKGIIGGYPDGSYRPSTTVTFGQFIAIATRLVAEDKIPQAEPGAHWADVNYKAAVSSGLISSSDFANSAKSLNAQISREDMAYILVNIAAIRGEDLSIIEGMENNIKDFNRIAKNRQEAVLKAYSNGLLTGSGGNFKPKDNLKRSEVAAVFCRVMDYVPRPVVPGVTLTGPAETIDSLIQGVFDLVNIERSKVGAKQLILSESLSEVAKVKADEQAAAGVLNHVSAKYGKVGQMLDTFGIDWSYYGENLAKNHISPEHVVQAWMNSPSHKENILSKNFDRIGVGYSKDKSGKLYWVQIFIRP